MLLQQIGWLMSVRLSSAGYWEGKSSLNVKLTMYVCVSQMKRVRMICCERSLEWKNHLGNLLSLLVNTNKLWIISRKTQSRNIDGWYVVQPLGCSRDWALRCYRQNRHSLEKRGNYADFEQVLREYVLLGYAEAVPTTRDLRKPECENFYLPAHSVVKSSSMTANFELSFTPQSNPLLMYLSMTCYSKVLIYILYLPLV